MASYQSQYDHQGRGVDEYGNLVGQTDEYGNPIHPSSTRVTYVATGPTGDTDKQHNTSGVRQHGTANGDVGGPFYGTNTADTGAGPGSGTTGYGTGTGFNTAGAHTEARYGNKEYAQHDQSHGDCEKKGIMDKIKEKLPGGHK